MPLQATSGAASYDSFGGGAAAVPQYIEDVFSTYLYTGTGANLTITNNIDLSTKGGMVWIKDITSAYGGQIYDTVRGAGLRIGSYGSFAQQTYTATGLDAFTSTGFSLGDDSTNIGVNRSGDNTVSWTFREQAKFFDIVTYTGNGANRTISHALGAVPGSIIVKRTDTAADWAVYHRSLANTQYLVLNTTAAAATGATWWNSTTPTSAVFSLGTDATVNASAGTYVAYIFAHDAGGFGLTGTDNVISCESASVSAANSVTVNLGYEPQFVLIKPTTFSSTWWIADNMRGMSNGATALLRANASNAEYNDGTPYIKPTATGFVIDPNLYGSDATVIYIAIRRGPMKVPTLGTSVFGMSARSGTGANATVTGGQTDDAVLIKNRGSAVASLFSSRLTGTGYLVTSNTAAEVTAGTTILQANPWDVMDGVKVGTTSTITNASANTYINYLFRRAPGFFDIVCYTASAYNDLIYHNLGVAPEMIIAKNRGATATQWYIYHTGLGVGYEIYFNTTGKSSGYTWITTSTYWNNDSALYPLGEAHVAYLFATLAGVSKVGSYTGTGTTKQIDCGFTAGARFVLIKRTDTTGDWYVWDTVRGIISGNDPYLLLNSTATEVTNTDYIDTYNAGFELSSTAPAAINANGGTYIFLAIA